MKYIVQNDSKLYTYFGGSFTKWMRDVSIRRSFISENALQSKFI